ncbi:MAG: metallophosphoesterase [Candidatus Cloacimonetes bacterium]|nr:metallophosphoesterase [Candidatus Cloacimonadota bacterium]
MQNKYRFIAVSDLHGKIPRYEKLFSLIREERPEAVFIAGDLTGGYYRILMGEILEDFILIYLRDNLLRLRQELQADYPAIFVILGNDDPRLLEEAMQQLEQEDLWHYMHNRRLKWSGFQISGYSFVPPTPFQMKDWEKYDVSRYVDVGAIAPDAGFRTIDADPLELEWGTIQRDLELIYDDFDLSSDICLFHSPPYKTLLDRAALDGKMIDYAPLDVHVGSIAIKNFITRKQPLLTIHGHVHESTRLTRSWQDKISAATMFNASHDSKELAVIRFDPGELKAAKRRLL